MWYYDGAIGNSKYTENVPVVWGRGNIGVARGCTGCACTTRADTKFWGPNLQGKIVNAPQAESAPSEAEQESNFLRKFERSGRWEVVSACVLRATTKKGRQLFLGRKMHPRQNPGYTPMRGYITENTYIPAITGPKN